MNEQIKRNKDRFPADFMFQLRELEFENLKSQFATSSWGGRRKLPLVFTEHGAIMAASVLNSKRAVQMSVYVVRAFVQLRELMVDHKVLADKLDALGFRVSHHDNSLVALIDAIRALTEPPKPVFKTCRKIPLRCEGVARSDGVAAARERSYPARWAPLQIEGE